MMRFRTAVATCFRKYFRISGRASRAEFWWFSLFCVLLLVGAAVIEVFAIGPETLNTPTGGPITIAVNVATWIPSFTVLIRRMHDVGLRGYFILTPLLIAAIGIAVGAFAGPALGSFAGIIVGGIIIAGILLQLYWLVSPSQPHENQFGPQPSGASR